MARPVGRARTIYVSKASQSAEGRPEGSLEIEGCLGMLERAFGEFERPP